MLCLCIQNPWQVFKGEMISSFTVPNIYQWEPHLEPDNYWLDNLWHRTRQMGGTQVNSKLIQIEYTEVFLYLKRELTEQKWGSNK